MRSLAVDLDRQRAQDLYRTRQILDSPQGTIVTVGDRDYLSFCSNDYLGLAGHPALIEALQRGALRYGVGSGASHLVSGHNRIHHELEEALAAFTGRARALLFSTGYMANLGVLGALARPGDSIFEDRLNHASLLDAALLSRARLQRYPHCDPAALEGRLRRPCGGERFVVTEGVFSMDGDVPDLPELAALAQRCEAWLMVDDAHGLGVLGPHGCGTPGHYHLAPAEVPILVGTLGKACGTFGAFVAGSDELIEALIQRARTYIYTTALPPAVAYATLAALRLVREDEWRRERLAALITRFRAGAVELGLPLGAPHPGQPPTPVLPLVLGDAARALRVSAALHERGILVTAIRPPTVPRGGARLRVTLCAAHTEAQVDRLLETLAGLL